jgi:large subunit ribosomal protein L9
MKVILTEKVKSVGNVGETVNVSQGFGRNFLIPNKLAVLADASNAKQIADHEKRLEKKVAEEKAAAQAIAKKLGGVVVTLTKKVGGNGSLFGTVTNTELARELEKSEINIERRLITIDTPIKTTGEFEVSAKLFKGVDATFKVKVEVDPVQAEEMKKKQEANAAKKAAMALKKAEASAEGAEESTDEDSATEETTTEEA